MPEISVFYGIRVTMNADDHNPPHFHVEYAGKHAIIDINDGSVTQGELPIKQRKLVSAWCELHKEELLQNWNLSKEIKPLMRIAPLI